MPRQKKPKITFKIPKDVYSKLPLTSEQTHILEENGWREAYRYVCHECRARGCELCHQMGILIVLENPRKRSHQVRGVPYYYPQTGASLQAYWSAREKLMHFTLDAQMGAARFEMQLPQLWELARVIVNLAANPELDARQTQLGFAVAANLFGPPVMNIAGIKSKGQTACTLKPEQRNAVKLLRDAGLGDVAGFLEMALKHECFIAESKRRKEVRAKLGKLKPGTILERKKNAMVFVDVKDEEHLVEIGDPAQSAVGVIR